MSLVLTLGFFAIWVAVSLFVYDVIYPELSIRFLENLPGSRIMLAMFTGFIAAFFFTSMGTMSWIHHSPGYKRNGS